jgi:hypothetical protein
MRKSGAYFIQRKDAALPEIDFVLPEKSLHKTLAFGASWVLSRLGFKKV